MKKNRLFALLLAVAMLLGVLAACGSTENSDTPAAETEAPTSEAPAVAEVPAEPDTASVQESAEQPEPSYTLPISEEGLTYTAWMTYAPFAADLVNTETMEGCWFWIPFRRLPTSILISLRPTARRSRITSI